MRRFLVLVPLVLFALVNMGTTFVGYVTKDHFNYIQLGEAAVVVEAVVQRARAFDVLVCCMAPLKLPDLRYGVTFFHRALFFAVVAVRNSQCSSAIARPRASTRTMGYMNKPPS